MNEQATPSPQEPADRPKRNDRKGKLIFLGVIVLAAVIIYMVQTRDLSIEGWHDELAPALEAAARQNRPVVVLFVGSPPSATALRIKNSIIPIPSNRKALQEGNYIQAIVTVDDLDSELARQYTLTELPTLMVLRPDGQERNRHEGNIGEVPFRDNFLANQPE
jgi:hypothetical protein